MPSQPLLLPRRHHHASACPYLFALLAALLLHTASVASSSSSAPFLFTFDPTPSPSLSTNKPIMLEDGPEVDYCAPSRITFGQAVEQCTTITLNPLALGLAVVRIPALSQVEPDDILLGLEQPATAEDSSFVYRLQASNGEDGGGLFAIFVTTSLGVTGNIPSARGFTHISPCRGTSTGTGGGGTSNCHSLTVVKTKGLDDATYSDILDVPNDPIEHPHEHEHNTTAAPTAEHVPVEEDGAAGNEVGDIMCARGVPVDDFKYCCETRSSDSCAAEAASRSCFSYQAPCVMTVVQTVSVAYTAEVRQQTTDILGLVQLAISETNQAYAKSQIPITLQLAEDPYLVTDVPENGNANSMLYRFKQVTNDRHGDGGDAHPHMRMLMVSSTRSCGIAFLDCAQYREYTCYAMVQASCATGYYSFGHELGHLQGANHNVELSGVDGKDNHGLVITRGYGQFGAYRTMMAYNIEDELRIAYFSNPAVAVEGKSTGITGQANNARVLRASRYAVARAVQIPTVRPTRPTARPRPTAKPTPPTAEPTSRAPTTRGPTLEPTLRPTREPTTREPTLEPTLKPTLQPTTGRPTVDPTLRPTREPTTLRPTFEPTLKPTVQPITTPAPTVRPTTGEPTTGQPSLLPTQRRPDTPAPTPEPTLFPTFRPTRPPTVPKPTQSPSAATPAPAPIAPVFTRYPTASQDLPDSGNPYVVEDSEAPDGDDSSSSSSSGSGGDGGGGVAAGVVITFLLVGMAVAFAVWRRRTTMDGNGGGAAPRPSLPHFSYDSGDLPAFLNTTLRRMRRKESTAASAPDTPENSPARAGNVLAAFSFALARNANAADEADSDVEDADVEEGGQPSPAAAAAANTLTPQTRTSRLVTKRRASLLGVASTDGVAPAASRRPSLDFAMA